MRLLTRLHDLQHEHGYLREEHLRALAKETRVPLHRLQGLVSFYPFFRTSPPAESEIKLCRDVSCWLAGGETARVTLAPQVAGENAKVEIKQVSCLGRCDAAPACLRGDNATNTVSQFTLGPAGKPIPPLETHKPKPWRCDPYANAAERYGAFRKFVVGDRDKAATAIIEEVRASGLRGMGGAGFPTGTKVETVRQQNRFPKYVIANADESEPGTFKDRVILSDLPHLIIEGMLLAGLVVGASHGILFIRHEYEPERHAFAKALDEAKRQGIVGRNILGSGFDFEIEIFVSPGGYILGEETALLEVLEDKRGEPRNKPPFPAVHGLHGQPTLINNVETLAMGAAIVRNGAAWWQTQGRPGFSGLKLIAVSGHVERPGVYEIATGTTVRELIELAGGIKGGLNLKAFAPGGASSNWLPGSLADTPLDFAAMAKAGSMLGSGALIVVAEGTDMLALAANLVRFFRNESCGKCVPCRVGTEKAVELLDGVMQQKAPVQSLEILPELGETLNLTSICGLGQVALNPILSIMKHWPDEIRRSKEERT